LATGLEYYGFLIATLGKTDEFHNSKEDWREYEKCLTQFFLANSIEAAEKKRAVLLSVIGSGTYKLLRNLLSPDKPGDKDNADIIATLAAHFSPPRLR